MSRYQGKLAIVTGGSSGIGKAIVEALLSEGAEVIVADLKAPQQPGGERQSYQALDIAQESSWNALFSAVRRERGRLDLLVNCAGILLPADIEHTGTEDFMQTMSVNAMGPMLGCKLCIAEMVQYGRPGAIVNVASTTALRADPWYIAYAASKAAVVNMTRTIALHCCKLGYPVRVNAVLPGVVLTPMVEALLAGAPDPQAAREQLESLHPMGRLLRPEEIAPAVLLLGSDEASGMTGASVCVDAGLTIG